MNISSIKITNVLTQKVVTVGGDNFLRQFPSNDSGRQRFIQLTVGKTQLASRGFSTHRVVDAFGGDLSKQTALQIFRSNGNPNQLWKINQEATIGTGLGGSPVFSIKADETDMAWDIPNGDPVDGNFLQIYPWHGHDNQLFLMESKPVEAVMLKSVHSGLVLDVPGFANHFINIQQYEQNNGFNQFWELTGPAGAQKIRSISSGLLLTSSIVTVGNDTTVYQGIDVESDKQRWIVELAADNTGTIQNVETNFFLSVPPGPVGAATPVIGLPDAGGADYQRWQVIG
jgi:hypothetical protein